MTGFTLDDAWLAALRATLNDGEDVAPRGMRSLERRAVTVRFDADRAVLAQPRRRLNYRFAVAEFLWIAAGLDAVEPLARYNSRMREFSDDGLTLSGAYGPRLAPQWDYVLGALRRDQATRQAVALVWRPMERASRDVPCTVAAQFLARRGRLHSHWSMRSSDLWLGLPYDAFTFARLTACVAGALGLEQGDVAITAGSSHLYEEHWEQARQLLVDRPPAVQPPRLSPLPGFPPPGVLALLETGRRPSVHWEAPPWSAYAAAIEARTAHDALLVFAGLSEREAA